MSSCVSGWAGGSEKDPVNRRAYESPALPRRRVGSGECVNLAVCDMGVSRSLFLSQPGRQTQKGVKGGR